MTILSRQFFVVLGIGAVLLAPVRVCAFPESAAQVQPEIRRFLVSVRSVGADNQIVTPVVNGPLAETVAVDERISDLRDKLKNLKYRHFALLESTERTVTENQIETVPLYGGHSVALKPVRFGRGRIGLWLRWTDERGSEVLNTKMHFDSRESMLAGMEREGNKGVILAIGVRHENQLDSDSE